MRDRTIHLRGFTMIELVLVLVILGIAIGVTAPSLRGWGMNAKLRDATQQFVSATRYARAEAAARAATVRVALDAGANTYAIQRQQPGTLEFAAVDGEFGNATALPPGFTLQMVSGGVDGAAIDFYPTLRATPATVRFNSPTGLTSDVACDYPAGSFHVVEAK